MATTRWERVAEAIREQIRSGRLRPGDYIPSYAQLQETHGVSYGTVRDALRTLRMEGWLEEGEQGVGTRVREDHPG